MVRLLTVLNARKYGVQGARDLVRDPITSHCFGRIEAKTHGGLQPLMKEAVYDR